MTRFSPSAVSAAVVAVLALGAIASVAIVTAQNQHRIAEQEGPAARYSPPAIASPQPSPLPVVAIVGDGAVNQSVSSVDSGERWPARIADSQRVRTSLFADASAGYTVSGGDGRSFVDQASRVPRDATLVMFVGGAADAGAQPLELIRAASDAVAAAKKRAPSASILVVGPVVAGSATAGELETVDNTLQNAAAISEATFADPLGQRWLGSTLPSSGSQLTAGDQRRISARLETVTQQLLTGSG